MRTRRVAISMTNSTYIGLRKIVSTVKKSHASRPCAWVRRNFRQELSMPRGAGQLALHAAISHAGLCTASRSTRSRISWPAAGRPGRFG
jgi:hypothetical protein